MHSAIADDDTLKSKQPQWHAPEKPGHLIAVLYGHPVRLPTMILLRNEREIVMIERWESPEALKVHGRAEALTTLGGAIADKLAAPLDVRRLSPVPAGEPAKGVI